MIITENAVQTSHKQLGMFLRTCSTIFFRKQPKLRVYDQCDLLGLFHGPYYDSTAFFALFCLEDIARITPSSRALLDAPSGTQRDALPPVPQ